jgi:hypothetical protein
MATVTPTLVHFEKLGIHGKIIILNKMDLHKIGFEDIDWIHLAQDRDRWWALVNTIMCLLQVPLVSKRSLFAKQLLASQCGFCSMELLQEVNKLGFTGTFLTN